MSLTRVAGGRTAIALMLFAAAAACLLAAGVLDAAFAQGTPFGAPRGAAPPPPADGIIGWIFAKQAEFYQQLFAHHPRRQDRRQRGVDLARRIVSVRHLPRRRPRPRQGGDLVLSRRQRRDLAARHRAVVRLGTAAGVRRGGARRHRGGHPQRHRAPDVRRGRRHRARELRADRFARRAADLGQGQGLHPRGARPGPAVARGRRRGDAQGSSRARSQASRSRSSP